MQRRLKQRLTGGVAHLFSGVVRTRGWLSFSFNPPWGARRRMGMRRINREKNQARCERLLERSELLDTTGIDWASVGTVPISRATIVTLIYMRDVEAFTNRYLSGLVAHPATLGDPLVAAFLPIWQREEQAHADALDAYLRLYAERRGIDLPKVQTPPPVNDSERWLVRATRPIGHVVTAAHMTWGAANELLTMTGYRLLAHRCGDPVLKDLLLRIAAQESRHYGFYYLQAEYRLAQSRLARTILPRIMRKAWTPVGVGEGFKSAAEFDEVLAYLCDGADGAKAIVAMDATFERLAGLDGVGIFARAARDSFAARAASGGHDEPDAVGQHRIAA